MKACSPRVLTLGLFGFCAVVLAGDPPEEVVRHAFEAQAAGDTAALLSNCDRQAAGESAALKTAELLERIRSTFQFRDFQFQHLATAHGDKGSYAVVRAIVSYIADTPAGALPERWGVLTFLVRRGEEWRILRTVPDDLLNMEIFLAPAAQTIAMLKGGIHRAGAIDIPTLNAQINQAMQGAYINEEKLALQLAFGAIGQAPLVGDTTANVYQVYETLNTAAEGVSDWWKYGMGPVAFLKFYQVGIGIVQIAIEPIPGLDSMGDMAQGALDQAGYNLELMRALYQVKQGLAQVERGAIAIQPRLALFGALSYDYPAGMELYGDETVTHSYGMPLARVAFTAPTVLSARIPFRIIGEIVLNDTQKHVATLLGAQQRGDAYYVPVEATHLADSDVSRGDGVLEGFSQFTPQGSTSTSVMWTATCRRGAQSIMVRLRSGETTVPIRIENRYMNQVTALQVPGMPAQGYILSPGQTLTGLRVIGTSPHLEERFWPNLSNRGECLAMEIANPATATLARADTVSLSGKAIGSTKWRLLLGGSSEVDSVRDIPLEVALKVETNIIDRLRTTRQVFFVFEGRHFAQTGGSTQEAFYSKFEIGNIWRMEQLGRNAEFDHLADVVWSGSTFRGVSASSCNILGSPCQLEVEGAVDTEKRVLTSLRIRGKLRLGSFDQEFHATIAGPVPLVELYRPDGPTLAAELRGPDVRSRVADFGFKSVWTNSGNLSYQYLRTDYTSTSPAPVITVWFR